MCMKQDAISVYSQLTQAWTSELAHKRHLAYCRRKAKGHPVSRKKSCVSCTKAKTQCDLGSPQCMRCFNKCILCTYERCTPESVGAPSTRTDIVSEDLCHSLNGPAPLESPKRQSELLSATDYLEKAPGDQTSLDLLDKSLYSPVTDPKGSVYSGRHVWEKSFPSFDTGDPLFSSTTSEVFPVHDVGSWLTLEEPHTKELYSLETPSTLDNSLAVSSPKAFSPREIGNVKSRLNRAYVIVSLRSYPEMLLSGETLPPFIHLSGSPSTLHIKRPDEIDTQPALPGPLAICASVVQMFKTKNKGNASFVWSTVRQAQEKLAREVHSYSDLDTMAALQAITMYLILRVSEDENADHVNFDVQLIQTMVKICLHVNSFSEKYAPSTDGGSVTWEHWIVTESIRRSLTIILLIDQLFDLRPGLPGFYCDGAYLRSMTLPSSGKLWLASDESTWRASCANDVDMQGQKVRLRYGDLVDFNSSADSSRHSQRSPLESWLARADGLGTLIMASASLIPPSGNASQRSLHSLDQQRLLLP